jgi:hypothetical protein
LITAAIEVYRQGVPPAAGMLSARIDRRDGSPSGFAERRVVAATGPGSEPIGFPIDTTKLPAGRYVLRVSLHGTGNGVHRAGRVVRNPRKAFRLKPEATPPVRKRAFRL